MMAAAVAAAAQPTNLPSGVDFNSFKIVVERNIFNQSRMPHEGAVRSTRIPDSFSLVGTLFYSGGDIAFFDGSSADYQKALKVDGDIAGFKVTAITLNSVTLSEGTNQTVLKITAQMRRDDDGHWLVSTEPVGNLSPDGTEGLPSPEMEGNSPDVSVPAGGANANDALARLMQRRAQQEQQLGHGQ